MGLFFMGTVVAIPLVVKGTTPMSRIRKYHCADLVKLPWYCIPNNLYL